MDPYWCKEKYIACSAIKILSINFILVKTKPSFHWYTSKKPCLHRAIQYQASTVNLEHSFYENFFKSANQSILTVQGSRLCITGLSEFISFKTESVDSESEAFLNISAALMCLIKTVFVKKFD